MSATLEKLENSKVKLTFSVSPERFEEGMVYSFNKNKGQIQMPGFRKGKVPRKMIEKQYGAAVFYEDAINFVFPEALNSALKEHDLTAVSRPEIDFDDIEPDKDVVFITEIFVKPEVSIENYKGITYPKFDLEVSDKEIDEEIDKARNQNSRMVTVTDRPSQNLDIVTIDYEGSIDGVPFEGGKDTDHDLILGSGSFIEGFEEQLIGKNVGDDVEVHVTFPEDYHSEELSSKPAVFKVEIKDIKEKILPELDDDFAQDVSEFDTLAEYRDSIKKKLAEQKEKEFELHKENHIMRALIQNLKAEIPEVMFENKLEELMDDFKARLRQNGLEYDMYLRYTGASEQDLRENMMVTAVDQVKGRLAVEAVVQQENYEVTDEEIDNEIQRFCDLYQMEKGVMKQAINEDGLKTMEMDVKVQKAMNMLRETAVMEE